MNDPTRAARASATLIRVTDRGQQQHLLLVEAQNCLRDQVIQSSETGQSVCLTTSRLWIRVYYLDGPYLDVAERIAPVADLGGIIDYGYDHEAESWRTRVKLSNGYVVIDHTKLRGLGLGTYLFAQVVLWAQQLAPDGDVQPIRLSSHQARDGENKERRNRFYEAFGFTFDYRSVEGIEHAEGSSHPIKACDLIIPERENPGLEKFELVEYLQKHFRNLRLEWRQVSGEAQRHEKVIEDYAALRQAIAGENWIIRFGRWVQRFRH